MKIIHLFSKSKENFIETKSLNLIKDLGIDKDLNALIANPRQILIASYSVINEFGLSPSDLKANIILDENIEQYESGQVIRIGDDALIRLTFHCEPCYKLDKIKKGLAKEIIGKRGFLGMVIKSGNIKINDTVKLTSQKMTAFSDIARERFFDFVKNIPKGKVVKTSDIIIVLGLARGYYRAIPGYLKKYQEILPVHRIVTVDGELMEKYVLNQKERLLQEGVIIENNKVLEKFYWNVQKFFDN